MEVSHSPLGPVKPFEVTDSESDHIYEPTPQEKSTHNNMITFFFQFLEGHCPQMLIHGLVQEPQPRFRA